VAREKLTLEPMQPGDIPEVMKLEKNILSA
jgi:hypothetical protein